MVILSIKGRCLWNNLRAKRTEWNVNGFYRCDSHRTERDLLKIIKRGPNGGGHFSTLSHFFVFVEFWSLLARPLHIHHNEKTSFWLFPQGTTKLLHVH